MASALPSLGRAGGRFSEQVKRRRSEERRGRAHGFATKRLKQTPISWFGLILDFFWMPTISEEVFCSLAGGATALFCFHCVLPVS